MGAEGGQTGWDKVLKSMSNVNGACVMERLFALFSSVVDAAPCTSARLQVSKTKDCGCGVWIR